MTRRARLVDPDAEEMPPLPKTDDVTRMAHLLEWARRRGFRLGPTIQVGNVTVQVADIRQAKAEGIAPDSVEDRGVYAELGLKEDDIVVDGTGG